MTKPATIDDKALAAVDDEWRTAREIFALLAVGHTVSGTRGALIVLANTGKIERRYDTRQAGVIARYRRLTERAPASD
jgi:hypothetical protein